MRTDFLLIYFLMLVFRKSQAVLKKKEKVISSFINSISGQILCVDLSQASYRLIVMTNHCCMMEHWEYIRFAILKKADMDLKIALFC